MAVVEHALVLGFALVPFVLLVVAVQAAVVTAAVVVGEKFLWQEPKLPR